MKKIIKWIKNEIKKEPASIIGFFFSLAVFIYSSYSPKNLIFASQSIFGSNPNIVISLSILSILSMIIFVIIYSYKKYKNTKKN